MSFRKIRNAVLLYAGIFCLGLYGCGQESKTYDQAELFYGIYADMLPKNKRRHLESFIRLKNAGFIKRRLIILKNRFFKSGFLRNVGLLFYV